MPRIRSIKPEFWADEKLGPEDPITRLVFIGLISLADDAGRLVDSVKQLDAQIFPYSNHSCREALARLSRMGRVVRGTTASGQKVIQVTNWHHQKVDHPNMRAALPPICQQVTGATGEPRENVASDSRESREQFASNSREPRDSISTNDLRSTISTSDQEGESKSDSQIADEYFEQAWQFYPKRSGANSKIDAKKAWNARIRSGTRPEDMLGGTIRYLEWCKAEGQIGSKFVMQGVTFFGPSRKFDEEYALPEANEPPPAYLADGISPNPDWLEYMQAQNTKRRSA